MLVAARSLFCGALFTALISTGSLAVAQQPPVTVSTVPGKQARGAKMGAPELPLTLQKAVTLALEHNINLEVSRLSLAQASEGFIAATGIFDPVAQARLAASSATTPATSELIGAQVNTIRQRTFNLGLSKLLPTGAQASVTWNNSRSKTKSSYEFLNPSYNSGLTLSLTQPLLQGFGTDVTRSNIEVARRNRKISLLEFERIVTSTLQQVESAYWNLVYTRENLKVQQESLKLAQDLLDQTRTRVRIGTSAPIDIVQSEATVAAREQSIISAENAVQAAADQLKQLMGFENLDDWASKIVPLDSLGEPGGPVDLNEAIKTGLEQRVELKEQVVNEQIRRIGVLVAANATKPQLDMFLNYGRIGVDGTQTLPGLGVTSTGGWGDAIQQIWNQNYEQWSAGVNFSFPLGNHEAKATLAQRRFQLDSATQAIAAERQQIIAEVRQAVRNLADSAKSITASVKARELAEQNLDAEQKKFANGMSTNYQVLQIQADLAAAQVAELNSRVAYRNSRVAYDVAVGSLLPRMGIALEDIGLAKEPHTALKNVEWLKYGHWSHALPPEPEFQGGKE